MTVEFAKWWLSEWKIIIVSKVRYVRNQWMNELMKYTKMSKVNLVVAYTYTGKAEWWSWW